MTVEHEHLAQTGDSMFERNIAIISMNNREITVRMTDGFTVQGFVAGLDDENIQICKSSNAKYVLCNREQIVTYEETGRSLKDVKIVDPLKEELANHIKHFSVVAKGFYSHKKEADALPA